MHKTLECINPFMNLLVWEDEGRTSIISFFSRAELKVFMISQKVHLCTVLPSAWFSSSRVSATRTDLFSQSVQISIFLPIDRVSGPPSLVSCPVSLVQTCFFSIISRFLDLFVACVSKSHAGNRYAMQTLCSNCCGCTSFENCLEIICMFIF